MSGQSNSTPTPKDRVLIRTGEHALLKRGGLLTTFGLGSCLGLILYCRAQETGGLIHCLLPDSSVDIRKAADQPEIFVDTGVTLLIRQFEAAGIQPTELVACVYGGASMPNMPTIFNVGRKNIQMASAMLKRFRVRVVDSAVGGHDSRSVFFDVAAGEVEVRVPGQEVHKLCL